MDIVCKLLAVPPSLFYTIYKFFEDKVGIWGAIGIAVAIAAIWWFIESFKSNGSKESRKSENTVMDSRKTAKQITESSPDEGSVLSAGTLLHKGRYRIEKKLSSGGFGIAYLACDTLINNRRVVIKELYIKEICSRKNHRVYLHTSSSQQTFENIKNKFKKEAVRLQSLQCPNIVHVYESFEENGTAYYAMSFISGMSLREMMVKKGGKISEASLRRYLPGLFNALRYIHHQKIWHLDVKPANLMLSSTTDITLIDFGASKQYEDSYGNTLNTSTAMAYTQGFAPIEQMARPPKNIGPWTDIYALGATFYTTLTGENPPTQDDIIANNGIPALPPSISSEMAQTIRAMMQVNFRLRPQSIEEVASMLNIII